MQSPWVQRATRGRYPVGRGRHGSQKLDLLMYWCRRTMHIPSAFPSLQHNHDFSTRVIPRTLISIHASEEQNLWQIPPIYLQTKNDEKLEIFHCRLKALGAHCRLGTTQEDLIKDLFIAFMNNTEIQSELLTETRTPAQFLQYALNEERGQENQRAIAGYEERLLWTLRLPMLTLTSTNNNSDTPTPTGATTTKKPTTADDNRTKQPMPTMRSAILVRTSPNMRS